MSRICDSCDNKLEGAPYEFKGTLIKKGGKRPIKIELEDICPKCVQVLAKTFGFKLPGNFGGKKRGRKPKKDAEPSFSGPSTSEATPAPAEKKKKRGRPPKKKDAKAKIKAKKGDGKGKGKRQWGQPDVSEAPPPDLPSPPPAPSVDD